MSASDKTLAWLSGEIKTPPLSPKARLEAGFLLRRLQRGDIIGMPESRPMPIIGTHCHELRVNDQNKIWRIVYQIETESILILEVFEKKTQQTPKWVIEACKKRILAYRNIFEERKKK